MNEAKSKLMDGFLKVKADLLRARDELQVQAHLASMDAKDAWKKLEPRLEAFEEKAERAAEQTAEELERAANELYADVEKLRAKMKKSPPSSP